METMGPIPNSGSKQCAFPNVSPAPQWPRARKERNGSARRPGGRGFSLAVVTMLAAILISSVSSAEISPRGELEEFIRMFTGVVEHAYLEIVQSRLPRDRPLAIRILGEDTIAERGVVVRTEVQARYGSDMQLDYLMTRSGKGWLIG